MKLDVLSSYKNSIFFRLIQGSNYVSEPKTKVICLIKYILSNAEISKFLWNRLWIDNLPELLLVAHSSNLEIIQIPK